MASTLNLTGNNMDFHIIASFVKYYSACTCASKLMMQVKEIAIHSSGVDQPYEEIGNI